MHRRTSTLTSRTRIAAVGCAAALTVPLALAVPATAAPLERERIVVEDQYEIDCDGATFDTAFTGELNLVVVERGASGLPHFNGTYHETYVYTNPETGLSYTGRFDGSSRDQSVTDNGDGTLSIVVQNTGAWRWFGPRGGVLFLDTGVSRFELSVEHAGTPADPSDDGDVVFVGDLKQLTGRTDTLDRDFCADLIELTG